MANIPAEMTETLKLMEGLVDYIEADAAELDEVVFKRDFLPLLTADKEVDLRAWVAVAGHPSRRVNITGVRNGERKVLYTVPGLMNLNGFTKNNYHHATSFLERIQTAMRRISNTPALAKSIYDEEMAHAAIEDSKMNIRDVLDWNNVLVQNGMKPLLEAGPAQGVTNDRNKITTEGFDDF